MCGHEHAASTDRSYVGSISANPVLVCGIFHRKRQITRLAEKEVAILIATVERNLDRAVATCAHKATDHDANSQGSNIHC